MKKPRSSSPLPRRCSLAPRVALTGFFSGGFKAKPKSDDDEGLLFLVKVSGFGQSDEEEEAARNAFTDAQMTKSVYEELKGVSAWKKKCGGGTKLHSRAAGKDVKEDDEALTVRVDMPGLSKEDVEVRFANDLLCVKGERGEEERKYSEHTFVSSQRFKVKEMKAEMKNGVLTVVIPKLKVEEREDFVMVKVD